MRRTTSPGCRARRRCSAGVLELDGQARRRLNPRRQAPFYLFLDEHLIVQASNLIGDEDWQSFLAQMDESGAGGAAPPLTTP